MNWPMEWGLGTYVWVENDTILRWEVAFDESRKDHMWTTLSEIADLCTFVEKFPEQGIWDMWGFKLNVFQREKGGSYCKGPTRVKTYATFALMSNSELTEVTIFLKERIDVMKKPRMGLVRTLETLGAELEFRGLDTGYVVWLTQRAKEKGNTIYQAFINWARRIWEEANHATPEEYKTSSSKPIKTTILDSVRRETDRLLTLARGFNLEMDPIELNTNLEEVESSLSEFIRGHFDSSIGTPYQIALSRSNEAQAEIAIAYFRGLIWLLLTFSEPEKVITYREELDRLWSGKSISTRQQILHDAMIAIFDDELLQHAIQTLKEKEISPIVETLQTDIVIAEPILVSGLDTQEQEVVRNDIVRNDIPKAEPTFTVFLERHQEIMLAHDGLISMAKEILESMAEQGLSREKQQQTLDRMIENFREIFSDRLNEVIKILQSSIPLPVMSPVQAVSKTVNNPKPVERHPPVVMNDTGRRGLKLRNFLTKEARTKFFVGKREMSFIDILTEIAPSSNFALDYKARIKELNLTLKRRGLTSIPTTLMGLGSALSWGEKPYITRNDLLARYKIAIPLVSDSNKPDDQKVTNVQGTQGTIKTVKLHKKEGKKAVPITERQRVFIQVLDIPFGTPETTLREILPGIFGVKHGFWKIFFEELWKINAILVSRWIRALPTTTTGFCLFLTGETSRTRKEIEALFLSFWITIGQKSIETESPVGNDKNDEKATCDEEIRIIVPVVSQSEISVVPQDPEPDIETKKSGKISGSLTKDISPFSPEEAAIIRLLIELPVSADRFAALVRYSSKHNMDRSNQKKVPESIDGWLVRAGALWKCLAELEQFLTQIPSSNGQGSQKHFARIFIEDILPELLSAGDEARALDVLRSFTKTSLSLSAEYPLTIATLYRLAGNGWDQILGHIITATTIQISAPVSAKKTSPVPKKPRVTSWEWVLQEIVNHEATFFEWLKDYFGDSLPKEDRHACGFALRALKNIAKDCLSEDPLQIMQAHITVIEGNISIHFPSALTEQLRPFESYILDLITPEANVAQQIQHSLDIVWTE